MTSPGGSTGLSEVEATELQSLVTNLDQMAASLGAVPWRQWSEQHPQAREWDQLSVTQWLDRHVTHKAVAEEITLFTQARGGAGASISFLFLLFYIFSSGGMHQLADVDGGAQTWRIQGGSQQLSQYQAQQVTRRGGQVLLGHPVTSIAQRPRPTPRLLLTLGNGSQLLASCVVVAVPPPVWHATIQFSPPLSAERQQLGRAMFMGAAMKFVIFYSHAFWREPRLLAPTCKLDACGPVQNLYPACFEGTPALIGLATGRSALLLNAASEAEQREQVLQQLVLYWGSSQARDAVTTFTAKSWAQEPWSRGCFTALMPPGLATSPAGRSLREPEYAGQLLFAGTETAVNWYGYIEGGMQAGMEAGKQAVALAARLKEAPLVASKL
ncbi:hypothetical protein QJQ45_000804 [Haematococcus lacustris]|nr:hypothetical protein QJQ45_000804 [Haematococcus lacustris]